MKKPTDQPAAADQSDGAQAKKFGVEPTRQPKSQVPPRTKHDQLKPSADAPGPSAANAV